MPNFVRVKHNVTGHEYTKPEGAVRSDETVLDKPAVDVNGAPRLPKTNPLKGKATPAPENTTAKEAK